LWTVPDNAYGNSGLTKLGHSDGVGIGAPQFCERPYDMTPGSIVWLAFTAPVAGNYNFVCNAYAGIRFYKDTDLVAGADLGVNSITHMNAGQNLYLRVITAVDGTGWAAADLYTVQLQAIGSEMNAFTKSLADGTQVASADVNISAIFPDGFYVEKPDRSFGIRVIGSASVPSVGDKVTISGTLGTDNGERVVTQPTVTVVSNGNVVKPLGMNNRTLGGGSQGQNVGVTDGVGINNLGLLATTTGKVVAVSTMDDTTTLWIDDGSKVPAQSTSTVANAYSPGFKWTFWDPNNTNHSDWVDAVKGRTSPGSWAGNPTGDAASISDPVNVGKWSGASAKKPWSYLIGSETITSDLKVLLRQTLGWNITGYWLLYNQYGNCGIYKDSPAVDGVGIGEPIMVEYPEYGGYSWIGFKAPVTGIYGYNFQGSQTSYVYRVNALLTSGSAMIGTVRLNAGESLYFRSELGWGHIKYLTIELSPEDTPAVGLRVRDVKGVYVNKGDYVSITGMSSVTENSGARFRAIRPRSAEDVVVVSKQIPLSSIPTVSGGKLMKSGMVYRAIGVNYFDAFQRTLGDTGNFSYREGFAALAQNSIPFARIMGCGYYASEMQLYLQNKERYFELFDDVVRSAETNGVGLIPCLFWAMDCVPTIVGEPISAWGNTNSQTHAFMRQYVQEVVTRYKNSPAIWGWEFGNEYNLAQDIGQGITSDQIRTAKSTFASTVRLYDTQRFISSGDGGERGAAWHLRNYGNWTTDAQTQYTEMMLADHPGSMNVISLHPYDLTLTDRWTNPLSLQALLTTTANAAATSGKITFAGEFGTCAPPSADPVNDFNSFVSAIENSGASLGALWAYDEPVGYDPCNNTTATYNAYRLTAIAAANARMAQ
ncbi:MAG: cellulase family glycosylhydrolase, partial [Armatimonadota bacterium]